MKAFELLSSPEKWTQGVAARNITGRHVYIHHPTAVCFCMWGAIRRCYDPDQNDRIKSDSLVKLIKQELYLSNTKDMFKWNDTHSFEEVRNLLIKLDI